MHVKYGASNIPNINRLHHLPYHITVNCWKHTRGWVIDKLPTIRLETFDEVMHSMIFYLIFVI